jgi:hypothetical protein
MMYHIRLHDEEGYSYGIQDLGWSQDPAEATAYVTFELAAAARDIAAAVHKSYRLEGSIKVVEAHMTR